MHQLLTESKPAFRAIIDHLQKDLSSLRTGRATPALVESIPVSAYDTTMELKNVASINVQDAKTLIVEPWDKSLLLAIEKAIREADIGINPAVDGQMVRLALPALNEENRKKLVKTMKEKLEEARVGLRRVREDKRVDIKKLEIGEDEKFKLLDELDKLTKEMTEEVEAIGRKKEDEIMTV